MRFIPGRVDMIREVMRDLHHQITAGTITQREVSADPEGVLRDLGLFPIEILALLLEEMGIGLTCSGAITCLKTRVCLSTPIPPSPRDLFVFDIGSGDGRPDPGDPLGDGPTTPDP